MHRSRTNNTGSTAFNGEDPARFAPEREPTPAERLESDISAIRKVVSAADRKFDGFQVEAELDTHEGEDRDWLDCNLRISIEHNDDPECNPKRLLFAALWRIVQEGAGKGWVRLR